MISKIQWFDDDLNMGDPGCVCSLCGESLEGLACVTLFNKYGDQKKARFDETCYNLVIWQPELPAAYTVYEQPFEVPRHWQNEPSGELASAIKAFVSYMANIDSPLPTDIQLASVIRYCTYVIFAPCWGHPGYIKELLQLRYEIQFVKTTEQLDVWIHKALEIGIDPLFS